jgi:hypothetical protein
MYIHKKENQYAKIFNDYKCHTRIPSLVNLQGLKV